MSVSLFTSQVPALLNVSEATPVTVGITLTFSAAGSVSGARVYAPATIGAGTYAAAFWQVTAGDPGGAGTLLASATFGALTPGAWNTVTFSSPVAVTTGTAYVIGLRTSEGRYTATGAFFNTALTNSPITGIQGGTAAGGFGNLYNGRFGSGLVNYPVNTFNNNGYFIDVIYDAAGGEVLLDATLTATSGLTVGLVRETFAAATLTATASLSAALSRETFLSAGLTATGSLTAALTNEARLAAALTATAGLSVSLTVPPTGPVDPIAAPIAEELLACFTEQLATLPSPPKYIQLRVGQDTAPLIGPGVDECCAGLAWVRVAGVRPSWDSFPQTDNTWLPCGPLAYAVDLEMGMAFCMPWSTSDGSFEDIDPPSTADWAAAFATQMRDQTIMRRTAACCFRPTQRRAVGEWTPLPVEGGCTGGKLTLTVSVMSPCSDC